jgi:uncharacterized membrane protein YGL010W
MRTQRQFLDEYAASHRDPTNQLIHFLCIPIIFFASSGLLWLLPIGHWLGLPSNAAYWVNGLTLVAALATLFYLKLSVTSALAMLGWFALCIVGIIVIQRSGWSLLWISVGMGVVGWLVQFWGHKIEKAKPSFTDDIVFLLIGPLFVMRELREKLR